MSKRTIEQFSKTKPDADEQSKREACRIAEMLQQAEVKGICVALHAVIVGAVGHPERNAVTMNKGYRMLLNRKDVWRYLMNEETLDGSFAMVREEVEKYNAMVKELASPSIALVDEMLALRRSLAEERHKAKLLPRALALLTREQLLSLLDNQEGETK